MDSAEWVSLDLESNVRSLAAGRAIGCANAPPAGQRRGGLGCVCV